MPVRSHTEHGRRRRPGTGTQRTCGHERADGARHLCRARRAHVAEALRDDHSRPRGCEPPVVDAVERARGAAEARFHHAVDRGLRERVGVDRGRGYARGFARGEAAVEGGLVGGDVALVRDADEAVGEAEAAEHLGGGGEQAADAVAASEGGCHCGVGGLGLHTTGAERLGGRSAQGRE